MMVLDEQHPDVASKFHKGNFFHPQLMKILLCICLDHAQKTNNAVIKGDRGVIGLTEYSESSALNTWMVAFS